MQAWHKKAKVLISSIISATVLIGSSSVAVADGFDRWGANDVPVVIMLGQSNTDGRAVYSFNNNDAVAVDRIHPGSGKPCSVTADPTCGILDLRKIYLDRGKIAGGLNNSSIEFTRSTERSAIGDILSKRLDWNSTANNPNSIVRTYISRFHKNDNPSGKMATMQPRVADPADGNYTLNEVIANGTWNNKEVFGPEIGLAVKWRSNVGARPLYIIKFAVGGTAINSNGTPYKHWGLASTGVPLAGSLIRPAENVINDAVAAIRSQGKVPRLVGIYWGQGEADRNNTNYATSLKNLMERLRSSTGVSNAQFFIQSIYTGDDNSNNIHDQQVSACSADSNCSLISVNDYAGSKDTFLKYPSISAESVHYTAHGEMLIGARLFGKVMGNLPNAGFMK